MVSNLVLEADFRRNPALPAPACPAQVSVLNGRQWAVRLHILCADEHKPRLAVEPVDARYDQCFQRQPGISLSPPPTP